MKRRKNIFTKKSKWKIFCERAAVTAGVLICIALLGYGLYKVINLIPQSSKQTLVIKPEEITVVNGTCLDVSKVVELEQDGKNLGAEVDGFHLDGSEKNDGTCVTIKGDGEKNLDVKFKLSTGEEIDKTLKIKVVSPTNFKEGETFTAGNGAKGIFEGGVFKIGGVEIINRALMVNESYNPGQSEEAAAALKEMIDAANKNGISLKVVGSYRTWAEQKEGYEKYADIVGGAQADKYWAKAGSGDSQTGKAYDINFMQPQFIESAAGKWLDTNCYKYGFVVRFPNEQEGVTTFAYQPWHIRYVGKDLAAKLYNGGKWISLEGYFGMPANM